VITVDIEISGNSVIKSLKAEGHAMSGKKGTDIVCSAVTCLLRTAANLLSNEKNIIVEGSAEKPGKMKMLLVKYPEEKAVWLSGVTEFLKKGIIDLEKEFPDKINVNIRNIE
jgi:uncharacterized protein YsxB (DUF464 family)